jgi:apolipoprotein D and lipocalin family protein
MKKGTWLIALVAGAGVAGLAYALRPKKKVPDSAIVEPFDADEYIRNTDLLDRF